MGAPKHFLLLFKTFEEYFKFPGYLSPSASLKFADVPNGIQAITKVPAEGWLQWVALCGCYEFCVNTPVDAADPGNYGAHT